MRNSHLVLIMLFLIVIIIAGTGSIVLVLRSRAMHAVVPATHSNTIRPTAAETMTNQVPSSSESNVSTQQETPIPFYVSSSGNNTLMVGTLTGHFIIHQDTIEVTIEQGDVHFTSQYDKRFEFTEIRVATVSTLNDGSSYGQSESDPVPVTVIPDTEGNYILTNMTFSIPRTEQETGRPYWLSFELFDHAKGDYSGVQTFSPINDKKHPFYLPAR